jgi:hypothetical protein
MEFMLLTYFSSCGRHEKRPELSAGGKLPIGITQTAKRMPQPSGPGIRWVFRKNFLLWVAFKFRLLKLGAMISERTVKNILHQVRNILHLSRS